MHELLTREEFNEQCLERDNNQCVLCGSKENLSVHHIMERKLFGSTSGYYKDNGSTVCEPCHYKCEDTTISTNKVREVSNIQNVVLPDCLTPDQEYDKWGNIILNNGMRLRGPMFNTEQVQKVLQPILHTLFVKYLKYPRTMHLSYSPGCTSDDKILLDHIHLEGKEIVLTVKMDGENTTLYNDHYHARSLDSANHPSRNWVKQFHSAFAHDIPEGYRICGENLYAKHALHYTNLKSYFYGFSIWNEYTCLSWDETLEWFELFSIQPVEVLYRGVYDEKIIRRITQELDTKEIEGCVLRLTDSFKYEDFSTSVAKWVREGHVLEGSEHWAQQQIIPNKLKDDKNE